VRVRALASGVLALGLASAVALAVTGASPVAAAPVTAAHEPAHAMTHAMTHAMAADQASATAGVRTQLDRLRRATAKYHSIAVAEQNGYGLLTDTKHIACIDMPHMGAMGVHWAKPALVGDGKLDALHPEALVYAPGRDGTLSLAAVEYVILKADWDAHHKHVPRLYGARFDTTKAPNRYGLPAFYSLHVWVWKANPAGTFAMWNPRVTCPA
jgi:hypothetical protein